MTSINQQLEERGYQVVAIAREESENGIDNLARQLSETALRIASGQYLDVAAIDAEFAMQGDTEMPNFIPAQPATLIYADINWNHERYQDISKSALFIAGSILSTDGRTLSCRYNIPKKKGKKK